MIEPNRQTEPSNRLKNEIKRIQAGRDTHSKVTSFLHRSNIENMRIAFMTRNSRAREQANATKRVAAKLAPLPSMMDHIRDEPARKPVRAMQLKRLLEQLDVITMAAASVSDRLALRIRDVADPSTPQGRQVYEDDWEVRREIAQYTGTSGLNTLKKFNYQRIRNIRAGLKQAPVLIPIRFSRIYLTDNKETGLYVDDKKNSTRHLSVGRYEVQLKDVQMDNEKWFALNIREAIVTRLELVRIDKDGVIHSIHTPNITVWWQYDFGIRYGVGRWIASWSQEIHV